MTRDRVLTLTLLALTALAIYMCYLLVRPFVSGLAWAVALAVVAYPVHDWISRRVARPSIAAGLSVAVVALFIVVPTVLATHALASELGQSVQMVLEEVESGHWLAVAEQYPSLASTIEWVSANVDVRAQVQRFAEDLLPRLTSVVTGSIWGIVQLAVAHFTLFFLFRDRCAALETLESLVPVTEIEFRRILVRVRDTIHATVYGTLVVALAQGVLGGLVFWWLGLPSPLLWGMVMALLSIVPVFGTALVWAPAVAALAAQGSWGKALFLAVWGLVVVSLADNLLYPILVGKEMRLHTAPVFFAILGGLALFGASGIILGPTILAVTLALLDLWRRRARESATESLVADAEMAGADP